MTSLNQTFHFTAFTPVNNKQISKIIDFYLQRKETAVKRSSTPENGAGELALRSHVGTNCPDATDRICSHKTSSSSQGRDPNTWILRRVFAPEPTPPGKVQRNPEELPNLMKLETVDYETLKPAGPLKVILLQDIEGVGHQFDVVNVDRRLARSDLLLTRKAVYASPFDLEYYAKVKKKMADELSKRVRIPYEYICIGRDLQALVVPIKGVCMLDDAIFLGDEPISGPNFEIEARLIRFYVVVSKQYIVPMLGRITHISADESKQDNLDELINNTELLQQIIDDLPGGEKKDDEKPRDEGNK
ncbi:ribosomal protein L9 domain protein [Necator americanus]|uniref:Large ribosomal subunit protein bL9m n=1 Tax=Necator americanus TaxID=51031 RepID=W2SLE3_NECAM|nr:ribosomal protein L9 domain protein [Necator americanus]ETN70430.1 ribosomal protein L9 domain protein [Necator americanus]